VLSLVLSPVLTPNLIHSSSDSSSIGESWQWTDTPCDALALHSLMPGCGLEKCWSVLH